MAIDVVVVNYRRPDLLRDFAASYEEHQFPGCTLTAVDVDPARDASIYLPTTPSSTLYRMVYNQGYGYACNRGAQHGKNDVILLANADTVLSSGLKECHDELMAHSDWGVLGPRQVNAVGLITAGGVFGTDWDPRQREWLQPDVGQCSDVRDDALTVSGSLFFVKREVWNLLTACELFQKAAPNATGAFLETKLYFEETFCAYHARAHGYKCVYYGPVQMTHLWHQSIAGTLGGYGEEEQWPSKQYYRYACGLHGIECE